MDEERQSVHRSRGPWGDESRHLPMETLLSELASLAPPTDVGELSEIVSRDDDGARKRHARAHLSVEGGVPGDAWARDGQGIDAQITMMRHDFACLIANGQDPALAGDNLFALLDLSEENLPTGTRLAIGEALLEVTPEPHTGCAKFRQRFGADALRLTAQKSHRHLRLRGIYVKVVRPGEVAVGDSIRVLERP